VNSSIIGEFKKAIDRNGTSWALWWVYIRYGIEEWILKKTAKLRIKWSKKLIIEGEHYLEADGKQCWEDVSVYDQWGLWVPYGFGIQSYACWEADDKFNKEHEFPEEPWEEVQGGEDWKTYNTKEQYLETRHFFQFARKHLKQELGDLIYDKTLELHLRAVDQKFIDEQMIKQAEWIKAGKPPYKIEFAGSSKEDFKKILGEEGAQELFDEHEKRNKEIDAEKQRKLDEERKRREDDQKRGEN